MAEHIVSASGRLIQDLRGMKFNRLTVIKFAGKWKGFISWWCTCECGSATKIIRASSLKNGHISSCGCIQRQSAATLAGVYLLKHGCCRSGNVTSEFRIWAQMRARCSNPGNGSYPRYGGRGIRVCERWLGSFEDFLADMGKKPSPKHTLDRVDNDGDYEPGNCRWATRKQQARNTRRNRLITHNGETKTIAEWSDIVGIDQDTIGARLARGWDESMAITAPLGTILRKWK